MDRCLVPLMPGGTGEYPERMADADDAWTLDS
jgi:hypothetical protein